ncbi:N-acetylmuramoyl-L-alanine amidase LytC precursor [Metalysinibacillus saudimassiliensis]|uniref:N-acetylmuramoyl-L-alanine amidase LytC n=1 Tax=Metalysinibacillus saudimassiliensis TaxID=1461583 RepID=A0A078LXI5_9BACL|nr:N-acetylmuramoyl-L-alanine amidase LytC precursor [Metalysinibacillus saudimassiliensis]
MASNYQKIFFVLLLLFAMITPVQAASTDLQVGNADVNLRQGPGLSYPVLVTLASGTPLTSLERSGDWIKVQSKHDQGWIASWLVTTPENSTKKAQTVVSQADKLNVRMEPNFSAPILAQLYTGDQTELLQERDGWAQINWNNQKGWVSKDYIAIKNGTPKPTTATDSSTFTVVVDALRMRSEPSLDAKEIGIAKYGEQFPVISQQDNWVEISVNGSTAWLYSFYGSFSQGAAAEVADQNYTTVIYNETNVRASAETNGEVIARVHAGEKYPIVGMQGDWYEIQLENGTGFVANWVVSTDAKAQQQQEDTKITVHNTGQQGVLSGKTIVIDPGHGGQDRGTTGYRGTDEKDVTLKTAALLSAKLQAAGANIVLTREADEYVTLRKRVSLGHQVNADAFISIHYDANENSSITGSTTYYFHDNQINLATSIHQNLMQKVSLNDRGVQPGNYYVVRENRQEAVLIELGFLTNPSEEQTVTSAQFREQATLGIYNGILQYFGY